MDKKNFLNFVSQGYQRIPVSKTLENFNIDTINKIISAINNICRFWSVKGTNPSFMKVKNVTIPIKIHKNEDKIIQLKFFIILNIPNKR